MNETHHHVPNKTIKYNRTSV